MRTGETDQLISQILTLHRPVQWSGWRLWLMRIGRDPLAFVKFWCEECHKEYPCPTAKLTGVQVNIVKGLDDL